MGAPMPKSEYVFTKRVMKIGTSLGISIPSELAGRLVGRIIYTYIEDNKLVFSMKPVYNKYIISIRARQYTRFRDKIYYALTIPAMFARQLGITMGSVLMLEVKDDTIVAYKIQQQT